MESWWHRTAISICSDTPVRTDDGSEENTQIIGRCCNGKEITRLAGGAGEINKKHDEIM
jgi:hypothetical protein